MGTITYRENIVGLLSASVILASCWPVSPDGELPPTQGAAGSGATGTATCGNGSTDTGETCDDGQMIAKDGCNDHCQVEHGFTCTDNPSTCTASCGDGQIASTEQCDVGPLPPGGCSASCEVSSGFLCYGEPSACIPIIKELPDNDTLQKANDNAIAHSLDVKKDSIIEGSLNSSDVDYYRLNLWKQSVVRIETFDHDHAIRDCTTLDTRLALVDTGNWSPYKDLDNGIGKCSALLTTLPAGLMYVEVSNSATTSPAYHLEINFPHNSGMEHEPNQDLEHANTLRDAMASPNVFVGGTLTPSDVDYFSVAVPDGMSVRAEIIEMKPGLGPDCTNGMSAKLTLHDADAPRVAATGGGRGTCPLIDGTGTNGSAKAHDLPGGKYYLSVQSTATNAFDYNLVVTVR